MQAFQAGKRHQVYGRAFSSGVAGVYGYYNPKPSKTATSGAKALATRTATKTRVKSRVKTRVKSRVKTRVKSCSCKSLCIPVCENKILPKCMAYKSRKQYKRIRPTRKYRKRVKARAVIGIPTHRIVKLKSTCYSSVDPGAGTIYVNTLNLNSAFDPTGTFGTGQPLYYDQWSTMYNRYVVLGYKVSVQAVSTDNTNPVVVGFTPIMNSTGLSDWKNYREIAGTTQKVLSSDVDRAWFTVKGSIKKFAEPQGGSLLNDDTVRATVDANPTRMLHGHIYVQAMNSSADPSAVHLIVTVTQIVKFYVPVIPSRS